MATVSVLCEKIRNFFRCFSTSECCSENKKEEVIKVVVPVIVTPVITPQFLDIPTIPKSHSYPKLSKVAQIDMSDLTHHISLADNRVISVLPEKSHNPQSLL